MMTDTPTLNCRILVVDDDTPLAFMLTKFLVQNGLQADYTTSPKEAARLLLEHRYDFLLSDMMMPEISGLELMVWTRKHVPHTRILLMTAAPNDELKTLSMKLGAEMFLSKPLQLGHLLQRIKDEMSPGIMGGFKHIGLLDLVQMMALNPRSRILRLEDKDQAQYGQIWIEQGQVVHAQAVDATDQHLSGPAAFYQLLQVRRGQFAEINWSAPPARSIQMPLAALCMEAAQHLDENATQDLNLDVPKLPSQPVQRILLVDDDPLTLALLQHALSQDGFDLDAVTDAESAMEKLQQGRYDLLISDIHMPGMDGISLLLWVRSTAPHMAIILMSATPQTLEQAVLNASHMLTFLNKPVDIAALKTFLQHLREHGYQGDIGNIHILDLIQMYLFSRQRKLIQIQDLHTFKRSQLYFSGGQLLHAEYGSLSGEEAFQQVVTTVSGVFFEKEWHDPVQPNLAHIPVNRLMLQAGRVRQRPAEMEPSPDLLETIEEKLGLGERV
jgi:DNA-binding response OmpR family regulator